MAKYKFLRIANLKIYDALFVLRYNILFKDEKIEEAVLVSIDDESMKILDIRWPWPRGYMAGIIKKISEYSPACICVDLAFIGKSTDESSDLILAKSISDAGNVFLASYFGSDGRYVIPESIIAKNAKSIGFINKPRDMDNVARRARPFALSENAEIIDYSLAVKTAAHFLKKSPQEIVDGIPLLNDDSFYLPFIGKKHQYNVIPVWKVIKDEHDLSQIKNRIVFLGVTSEIFHDTYETPQGIIPGVVLNIAESISYIKRDFIRYSGGLLNFILLFIFVFITTIGGFRLSITKGIFLGITENIIFFILSLILLSNNILIDYIGVFSLVLFASLFLYGTKFAALTIENIILKQEAITDGLTKLYDYKYFSLKLKSEVRDAIQKKRNIVLALYDVDYFKNVNDTYGHEFGNKVLREIAKIMKENSRRFDTIARYGGEEFAILMPNIEINDAVKQIERIREKINKMRFAESGDKLQVTISAGIAPLSNCRLENYEDIIKAADIALYKSKVLGRDKTTIYDEHM